MKIKLWGTRGSIPTPSTSLFTTSKYGGDTTCVSVESGSHLLILDAGSGVRLLGLDLIAQKKPCHASFFFSHVHWDHIQGFPFFIPAFQQGNSFDLYGPCLNSSPGFIGGILEKAIKGQQEDLNFPVQLKDMPSKMNFHDVKENQEIVIEDKTSKLVLRSAMLNHPGGCFGYRIEEHLPNQPVKVFTYATDTEHFGKLNTNLQKIAKDADMLLYDCQYTPEEYEGIGTFDRKGWGHSTWEEGLKESEAAGVKTLILHHHDPTHDDDMVSSIEKKAQAAGKKRGIHVFAAKQLSEIEL